MNIREEMMSGRLYDASSGELLGELYRAQELCQEYNALRITDFEGRAALLDKLLPHKGSGLTIGDDVWIGGMVCVMPGVTIGSGSVIAGGSVVVKDIPPGVLAAGNPCRVVRPLSPDDRDRYVR